MRGSVGFGLLVLAAAVAPIAAGGGASAAGTLSMRGTVPFVSSPTECPSGVPAEFVLCHGRTGTGLIAGLGRVTETYIFMPDARPCPNVAFAILPYTARLSVAGKGDLELAVSGIDTCIAGPGVPRASPQSFTVKAGTGIYAGASGSGTLTRTAGLPGPRVLGEDTWTGTLVVAGLEFDLSPPTITGAKSKTVRVPQKATGVRVTYRLSATDGVDGSVPVSCRPASGSRFKIGRKRVICEATDRSGNLATASFTVTVARRR
jgi:HYR domain